MQSHSDDERGVKHGALAGPPVKRRLDVLVVELRRAEGRDGGRGVCRRKAVHEDMDRQKEERGGISGHGEHTRERTQGTGGEKTFENGARGVDE
jgi:hypothetical protein